LGRKNQTTVGRTGYDRQFLIDVMELGEETVSAYLKIALETCPWLTQNGKYEWQFLTAQLGIFPCHIIDTKILSQVFYSGDRILHDLDSIYEHFMRRGCPGIFEEYTGTSFYLYGKHKKFMQKSDWSKAILSEDQLNYASDDVRIIFPCYQAICEAIESWVMRYERHLPDNRGIRAVIALELSLLPMFAKMEQEGIKFDEQYYIDTVIPTMEKKRDEAYAECAKFSRLVWRESHELGEFKRCQFFSKSSNPKDIQLVRAVITSIFGRKITTIRHKKDKRKAGDTVEFKWIGSVSEDRFAAVAKTVMTELKGYQLIPSTLVNLRSIKLLEILTKMCGFEVVSRREKYLKTLYDPNNPRTEVIKYLMRYLKNAGYASRYGRNILNRISPNSFCRPNWNQIGSEKQEVVSGRSSAKDPPIMQMAGRATLYAYNGDPGISAAKFLRSAYRSEDGCVLIDGDYSMIEPKITAELTRDKLLTKIFLKDVDLYDVTAQIIFEDRYVPPLDPPEGLDKAGVDHWLANLTKKQKLQKETAKHQRDFSKIVRLGTTYGMQYKSLYGRILDEMPDWQVMDDDGFMRPGVEDDVKDILNRLNESHPGVIQFTDEVEYQCTKKLVTAGTLAHFRAANNNGERTPFGVVYSEFGRHRRFCIMPDHERDDKFKEHELSSKYNPDPENHRFYYNEFKRRKNKVRLAAFNHKVQSTSADILKFAELYVYQELESKIANEGWDRRKNRIVLVLHDEILLQVQEKYATEGRIILERCMLKAAYKFIKRIPVSVNIGIGKDWYSAGNVEKSKKKSKSMQIYKKRSA
jgi:hypothetical protein